MNSFIFDGVSIRNGRKTNMDSLMIKEKALSDRRICIAVICDGIGSLSDGAFASAQAVRILGEWFDSQTDTARIGLRMRDTVQQADLKISEEAARLGLCTGTTLSAILFDGESYYVVHVGDSKNTFQKILRSSCASGSRRLAPSTGTQVNIAHVFWAF